MSHARVMKIYPGEFFSVSQEENATEGDPDCVGRWSGGRCSEARM
jgi:hypothetical protein